MKLCDVTRVIGCDDTIHDKPEKVNPNITLITADSRQVVPGCVFVAIDGTTQKGTQFISQAIEKGARVVIQKATDATSAARLPDNVMSFIVAEPRQALAHLARAYFGAQPAHIAAITGTNGKTSTAEFLRQIWHLRGSASASIGTLGLRSDALKLDLPALTTPDPLHLAQALQTLKRHHIEHVAIEASSHGLEQYRLDGVAVTAAGFSNLTRDHLDYHKTLDAYRAAKLRLFQDVLPEGGIAAVNADMDAKTVAQLRLIAQKRRLELRTVGTKGAALQLINAQPKPSGQVLKLKLNGRTLDDVFLPLIGRVQVENVMLAAALAWEDAHSAQEICASLPELQGVPGRCEHVATLQNGATIFVDYAHTPDALQNLLLSLRPHTSGRIILVFGAGGNRDRGKRPLMGRVAAHFADVSIVTDDNPRDEEPHVIRQEILRRCPNALEVGERHSAIESAMKQAAPTDIVVIAGKGHESGQTIKGVIHPFNDANVVKEIVSIIDGPCKGQPHAPH